MLVAVGELEVERPLAVLALLLWLWLLWLLALWLEVEMVGVPEPPPLELGVDEVEEDVEGLWVVYIRLSVCEWTTCCAGCAGGGWGCG